MTTIPGQPKTVRQSRGSYSKLICLNCRSRKIKCILPVLDESIQPSGSPQPADKACIRCQQQGLECVIDKTILGRPSSKRKQTQDEPQSARAKSLGSDAAAEAFEEEDGEAPDVELKEFMLSEVKDELEHVAAKVTPKSRPEDYERFQALIDMYNLMSIVIGRDKKFASAANVSLDGTSDPVRLIKGPLVDELDARLAWVQIYFPYVPSISTLLKQNIASSPEVGVPAVSIRALILILALIAIDARATVPAPAVLERESITAALSRCGLELMFIPPTHRFTIYALDLIMEYCPTALVAGQNAAAAALKGELYITLMKRLGERLKLEASSKLLRVRLTSSTAPTEEILHLVYDSLLWARICYLDAGIGALITKPPAELAEAKTQLEEVATAVGLAFSQYLHLPAAAKYLYLKITILIREMQAYSEIKLHRSDLVFLVAIMHSHARSAQEQRRICASMLERHENTPDVQAIKELVAYDADCVHLAVAQHVTSFTLFSGYVPHDQDPTMEDVLALGDQIINHLKTAETWDSPQSFVTEDILNHGIPGYLARFSPTKPAEICHLLRFFLRNTKLVLNGVSWQPPSRELVAGVLYQCKMVTEENAGRMKGWAWLCEDVDTQLLLLEECARALATMDITTKEGKPTSLEAGSLFAATSKLIRGLATIVGAWNKRCQERQRMMIAAGEVPTHFQDPTASALTPSLVVDSDTWRAVERAAMREDPARLPNAHAMSFASGASEDVWNGMAGYGWSEVKFDDWNAWPQVNPLDRWDMLPTGDEPLNPSTDPGSQYVNPSTDPGSSHYGASSTDPGSTQYGYG